MENQLIINTLKRRNLDECFLAIAFIQGNLKFKNGNSNYENKTVYTIFGTNIQGKRMFIDAITLDKFEKTSDWYAYLIKLKNRGVSRCFYACIPELKQLKDAFNLAFKETTIVTTCYDLISKLYKYSSRPKSNKTLSIIKRIYLSETLEEYEIASFQLKEAFESFPFIQDLIDPYIKHAKKFYNIPYIIRKHVYMFYYIREISKLPFRIEKENYVLNSIDDYILYLLPAINSSEKQCYCPKKELSEIINILYETKKDLIIDYL